MRQRESQFQSALKRHRAGDAEGAERIYRAILARSPDHAGAWHLLGLVHFARGEFERAREQRLWPHLAVRESSRHTFDAWAWLVVAAAIGACAIFPRGRANDEIHPPLRRITLTDGEPLIPTRWEPRRYLGDERAFLVKFKEIAAEIEVFPFQWIVFAGAYAGNFVDNRWVTRQDAQRFFHFADLARGAGQLDLNQCADYLAEATPKERALLLVALHFSLDDAYLPLIARYVGDDSVPFRGGRAQAAETASDDRTMKTWGERISLGREVKRKRDTGADLNGFERRVLDDIHRFEPLGSSSAAPRFEYSVCQMRCVGDYAAAILKLRGCGLVEAMRRMPEFARNRRKPDGGHDAERYGLGYEAPLTVENFFGEAAWKEFRSMAFGVRRLRHEYLLHVECVAPPYQEEAAAEFARRLEKVPARTAALALFYVWPAICSDANRTLLLISDWPKYIRGIPKEQVVELLTSANLEWLDADLTFRPRLSQRLGYPPYFRWFLVYVLRHRSQWFSDEEFAEIEPRLSRAGQQALEASRSDLPPAIWTW